MPLVINVYRTMPTHEPTDAQEIETTRAQCQSFILHNVQQSGYNGFGWPLPNPVLQNTTKAKFNHVVPQH